jgi:hypothetical protein
VIQDSNQLLRTEQHICTSEKSCLTNKHFCQLYICTEGKTRTFCKKNNYYTQGVHNDTQQASSVLTKVNKLPPGPLHSTQLDNQNRCLQKKEAACGHHKDKQTHLQEL